MDKLRMQHCHRHRHTFSDPNPPRAFHFNFHFHSTLTTTTNTLTSSPLHLFASHGRPNIKQLGPAPPAGPLPRVAGEFVRPRRPLPPLTSPGQTENLFHTYSSFASSPPVKPTDEEQSTERKLHEILAKALLLLLPFPSHTNSPTNEPGTQRDASVGALSRLLDSEAALTSSATKLQNLSLHRSTLADHRREFTRLRGTIADARARGNLLSSVRDDISAFRSAARLEEGRSEADYMLDERERLDRSHSVADTVLSQAYAVNEDFMGQRQMLQSINRRIKHSASQVPGINAIVAKINTRKKRDSVILAGLIATCFVMMLWFR